MMAKGFSPFRVYSRKVILLPLFAVLTLLFCTNKTDKNLIRIHDERGELYGSEELYADTSGNNIPTITNKEGQPYTGTVQVRKTGSDVLRFELTYKNGHLLERIEFDSSGTSVVSKTEYMDPDGTGALPSTREYDENNVLTEEWIRPGDSAEGIGTVREWHPNGQLKFEMHYKPGFHYHGMMTRYNEEGEVVQQERYENGKLIEKIK